MESHGDILKSEFLEGYSMLTEKSIFILKEFLQRQHFGFLLKVIIMLSWTEKNTGRQKKICNILYFCEKIKINSI